MQACVGTGGREGAQSGAASKLAWGWEAAPRTHAMHDLHASGNSGRRVFKSRDAWQLLGWGSSM